MTYNLFSGQEIGEVVYFLLSVCVMYHLYINFPKHEDLSPYLTENRLWKVFQVLQSNISIFNQNKNQVNTYFEICSLQQCIQELIHLIHFITIEFIETYFTFITSFLCTIFYQTRLHQTNLCLFQYDSLENNAALQMQQESFITYTQSHKLSDKKQEINLYHL